MALLSEINDNILHKLMVYGDSGTGKTIFATSFPTPIRHFDFDRKVASAAAHWARHDPARLGQIDTSAYSEYNQYYTDLTVLEKQVRDGVFKFKTVVLDSATLWADMLMKEILSQNAAVKGPIAGRTDIPGMQHYQIFAIKFREQLGRLLALPCHVVVTAHIEITKDENTGEILRRPMAPGKNASYFPIVFGEVYRSFVQQEAGKPTAYMAQTHGSGNYIARTQIPNLPALIPLSWEALNKKY